MTDIVAAALAAARYADALIRRTAAEEIRLPPDEPHTDWQPKHRGDPADSVEKALQKATVQKWHPPYGETHIKYHIYRGGGGRNPIVWGANHHGTYQGMETVEPPNGNGDSYTLPLYSKSYEPDQLGRFRTPEKAKAAAEAHYRDNYSTPPKHDYDIDTIMGDEGNGPAPRRSLGDDEDYGHIFGMRRHAGGDDIHFPPEFHHDDWRPVDGDPDFADWRPYHGETHAHYRAYPVRQWANTGEPLGWKVHHSGTYKGMDRLEFNGNTMTFPSYTKDMEPDDLGWFDSLDEAKAGAEKHHAETYGQPPSPDYYDRHLKGDDLGDDYGNILGAVRHALRKASMALRRKTSAEIDLGEDSSHEDWQYHPEDSSKRILRWQPYVGGDTHAQYRIFPFGGSEFSTVPQRMWRVRHQGVYKSKQESIAEDGTHWKYPEYSLRQDPELVGDYPSLEDAQDAAHKHYSETYKRASPDYYDKLINPRDDLDEDYGNILGSRRTASVWDWKPYTPKLLQQLQEQGYWDGEGIDTRSWEARSNQGDHYTVRPAGSLMNTLKYDHPLRETGDPDHWEVEHVPARYGHDPEGYFGEVYGPTALNKFAHPVEGVHPHGFTTPEHAMDWVRSRHPEDGFDPDAALDPNDPRIRGASYRTAGVFDWKPSKRFHDSEATFAHLENGHQLGVFPSSPRNPEDGWDWYVWHGPKDDRGDRNVTGGGRGWDGDDRAYSTDHLPTKDHAQAAAEAAYSQLFPLGTSTGGHDSGVDYTQHMNPQDDLGEDYGKDDPGNAPRQQRGGDDDEDYSRIFDAVRRALKKAELALRRTAGDVPLWGDWKREDPRHETSNPDGTAEGYRADINDDHHMRVFRKNPSATYADDDISPEAMAESWYPHPVNMDTPWSYHVHGVGQNDNPYLKFHTPYDDNPHHTGFPDMETAQRAAESAYKTFAPGGHGPSSPDPDEHLDPNDPRIIGAGLHARHAARARAVSEAVQRRIAAELSPPCPDCGQVAGFDTHPVSDRILVCRNCEYPMTDEGHDGLLDQTLSGHDRAISSLPEVDHPSLGRHGHLDTADIIRLAGDGMSWEDTMAYIDQALAGGEKGHCNDLVEHVEREYPGSDAGPIDHEYGTCRDCGTSIIHNPFSNTWVDTFHGAGGHHPTASVTRLARGGMSWEETMKYIDQTLAEGEPEKDHGWDSDYSVPEPHVQDLNPVELDHTGNGHGLQCDHCQGHARNAFEVNHVSVGNDYKGKFCDGCLRDLVPRWYGQTGLEPVPDPTCHLPGWINKDGECDHPDHDYDCYHCGQNLEQHQERDCPDRSGRTFEPGDNPSYPTH